MRKVALLLSLSAGAFSACSPVSFVDNLRLTFAPPQHVIFGPEDAERWIAETREWICEGVSPCPQDESYILGNTGLPHEAESYWRPSTPEVRRFERKLNLALDRARLVNRRDPPGALWQYAVQYIGYVRKGERLIYAQGVRCYSPEDCVDVSEQWFVIMDGGTSVFGASYNPETGELFGLGFNGYA